MQTCLVPDITREQAATDLDNAERAAARVQKQSRWLAWYSGTFAAGFAALTLMLGLVEPAWLRAVMSAVLWLPLVAGMVLRAGRRPTTARGAGRRVVPGWVGSGVLFAVALFVGVPTQQGNLAYWLPAAAVVALPLVVVAWREARR